MAVRAEAGHYVGVSRFGRRFQVSAWLVQSYEALARRDEGLTEEEGGLVGLGTVCQLAKLRELSWQFACTHTGTNGRGAFNFTTAAHNMLEDELKEDEDYKPPRMIASMSWGVVKK